MMGRDLRRRLGALEATDRARMDIWHLVEIEPEIVEAPDGRRMLLDEAPSPEHGGPTLIIYRSEPMTADEWEAAYCG